MPDTRPPQPAPPSAGNWHPALAASEATDVWLDICPPVIGGVSLFATAERLDRRVLLAGQFDVAENGIYITTAYGPNLLSGLSFDGEQDPPLAIPVVPGRAYRYVFHSGHSNLQNGGHQYYADADFVAAGDTVLLSPSASGAGDDPQGFLHRIGLVRAADADSAADFGATEGGKRIEVLGGDHAGLWEYAGRELPLLLESDPVRFTWLGRPNIVPADGRGPVTALKPELPNTLKDHIYDDRGPQTPVPPKSGSDADTTAAPALPLLGISTIVTVNGGPVTVGGQPVTCIF